VSDSIAAEGLLNDTPTTPELILHAEFARKVTFASHQNDVPVLLELTVENASEIPLEDLRLSISADPVVFGAREWPIDRLDAGAKLRIEDRRLPLAGGMLDKLTDRLRVDIHLTLHKGDDVLVEATDNVEALARNEWGGSRYMPELLAAFVTPNDGFVQKVLKDASRILVEGGRDGSINGYQTKSTQRSWELMSSIWAAVSAQGLTYAVPPASFETTGQKIRLPSDIRHTGLSTCLDTALLFAAAFEQAGLHPVLVFTKEHAFAGAWLQPAWFPTLTVDDPLVVRKAKDLRELVLFETTMATAGHPLPFTKAINEANRQIAEEHDPNFIYALDVYQARKRGIQPLSSVTEASVGGDATEPTSAPPLDIPPDDLPPFEQQDDVDLSEKTPEERLATWKRSLLDLSRRNRLLNIKPSSTALPIFCPDPGRLEDLLAGGAKLRLTSPPEKGAKGSDSDRAQFTLRTGDDWAHNHALDALERKEVIANTDPKTLEKAGINLYRKARADIEEGGSNTLFLALGMLRWTPSGTSSDSRAPMILVPVRLERASARSKPVLVRHDDDTVFNLTLLQMLKQDFGIEMPELVGELPRDESGVDVARIWDIVRHRVRDVPGFEVTEDVILGTFSFAKYLMWKDLADRTERLKEAPLVRHLIDTPREPFATPSLFVEPREIDRRIAPSDVFAPLNADSSQLVAVHASGQEGDFVLEGPPGTGKSETIGNIIAHNLALGNRVLFVSEKMAALDVVYRRLKQVGLGDFCLELHSNKASKKAVLDQLDTAWSSHETLDQEEWTREANRLAELRDRLNGLVDALHAPGPAGISARDAMGRTLRHGDLHRVDLDWPKRQGPLGFAPTPEAFEDLCTAARRLGQRFSETEAEDFETFVGIDTEEWNFAWQGQIVDVARRLGQAAKGLLTARAALVQRLDLPDVNTTREEVDALAEVTRCFSHCFATDLGFAMTSEGRNALESLSALLLLFERWQETRKQLPRGYRDEAIASAPVTAWIAERTEALGRSFLTRGGALKKLRTAITDQIGPGGERPENDLEKLADLAELKQKMTQIAGTLPNGTPWKGLATSAKSLRAAITGGEALRAATLRLGDAGHDIVALRAALRLRLCEGRDLLEQGGATDKAGADLRAALDAFTAVEAEWHGLTVPAGQSPEPQSLHRLIETTGAIADRERRLNAWCGWVSVRREAEEKGLGAFATALERGTLDHEQTVEAFRTAYCRWAAPELIDANPLLRRFSATTHTADIADFRIMDAAFSGLTASYVRARLSGEIPDRQTTADPGLGVLARQLQRGTRSAPVRQLVKDMGASLTRLTPCLMMSPLSIAQFLPAESELFDLVVFDEASQITVPDAIGAIARGRRSIIVGDPKQMPPTNFFSRDAGDDDGDGMIMADLESILDEALAARVPLHRLTGHYRSRHESLIAFSNHAYYEGQLVTYPSADTRETAVRLERVDGVYARGKGRNNPQEARAVVAEVVAHLKDPARRHLSIGVVTLNTEQQRLVENLLDEARRADPSLERFFGPNVQEPVFVKNLETVQGDQRDVILISICYGPTEPGAQTISMNFGPLNQKGGERRLNVAITRATSEVVIFCSFDPTMIDLTRTNSDAVRDLKNYLEFAAQGPAALGRAVRSYGNSDYDSDFEMAVAERLRAKGWTIRTQIGVSKFRIDLGVVHPDKPGEFLAGIECDGAAYHSSASARDRDRVRHIILERLGWRLLRVWSTDWFIDPRSRLEQLHHDLEVLLETVREEDRLAVEAAALSNEGSIEDAEPESQQDATRDQEFKDEEAVETETTLELLPETDPLPSEPTQPLAERDRPLAARMAKTDVPDALELDLGIVAQPQITLDPDSFHAPGYKPTLQRLARFHIQEEAPITFKRLSDLIARDHGFQRTGGKISSTIWHAVERVAPRTRSADEHWIFWSDATEPVDALSFRGLEINGRLRQWKEVPLPEKLGLIRKILDQAPEDLAETVAGVLGYGRVTQSFRADISKLAAMFGQGQADREDESNGPD
jgi:very-short-patch-repair endonuclease